MADRDAHPAAQRLAEICRPAGLTLGFRRNRRLMVCLRRGSLIIHPELLDDAAACADLERFVAQQGRGKFPHLSVAMERIVRAGAESRAAHLRSDPAVAALELLGEGAVVRARERLEAIGARYFPGLALPPITWGRHSYGPIRQLRFGSYRHQPAPLITLHPRLAQPWVATRFVDHVIHHELCHHVCHQRQVRGEGPHGPTFKALEAQFADLPLLRAWEKANLQRFLA
jgi:hypothetical protein